MISVFLVLYALVILASCCGNDNAVSIMQGQIYTSVLNSIFDISTFG